ncbi:hypothetical protein SAMN02745883_00421 [Caminicella sporogenes DSM 14501]|uniref:Helix-turn-helix domain-containing protein n=1 Tax=Caminicella sporogenes DSM 14501 TaxID=1121266 RepID=A0A1M6M091_9FIRM|nr:hypothetical protein [Caminicella sporogenes]WIF94377.1 hypothetical protein QNI18_08890 [Caminicella sporogenes]SHJ76919.1 hypothetical protein SAMN02745883_00421 [Caminicella sporogenes DSM 14501]
MKKRIGSYLSSKNSFLDIDFHDFIELVENGYDDLEIARELGVPKEQVVKLRNELNKNY